MVYGLGFRVKGVKKDLWDSARLPENNLAQGLGFRV